LLQKLYRIHHNTENPAAAPSKGDRAMEPLPTMLPVTITLGPRNKILLRKLSGAILMET